MIINLNQCYLYVGVCFDFGIVSYNIVDDGILIVVGMVLLSGSLIYIGMDL